MEIITPRTVNASQLTYELGGTALRVVGPYPTDFDDVALAGMTVVRPAEDAEIDEAALRSAIEAHVADDGWVDPSPQPIQPLDAAGVAATLNAVLGVWSLTDAANAVRLPEQALIDEATAWAELAAVMPEGDDGEPAEYDE